MEAAGRVQFNLFICRRDKERFWDISVSAPVNAQLSGLLEPGEPEEKRGNYPASEGNTV
jgi:hypothetical protein